MKIEKIKVQNFKAVIDEEINLNGCSAIITAGNNKGKTSLLRGLVDRLRGEKPEIILKEGEKNGKSIIELSDGSIIEWKFTEKSESFSYTTKEGIKMTTGVISAIGEKYFGVRFDIDKFLNSSSKQQSTQLAKLIGLDFTEIDSRYKLAYEERASKNAIFKQIAAKNLTKPNEVQKPNIEELKKELANIKTKNENLRNKWKIDNEKHQKEIASFNTEQRELHQHIDGAISIKANIEVYKDSIFGDLIDFKTMENRIKSMQKPEPLKELTTLTEPDYLSELDVQLKLDKANDDQRLFDNYNRDLLEYNNWVKEGKQSREEANKADEKVKAIEKEKQEMISSANIPTEFTFNENGVMYNGLPLSNAQLSSSAKYIAALKLGAMALGTVRTMHFDASFLDKNSLSEIEKWAENNDLQLLIERPDFDGGEIKYEIIN